MTSRLRRVPIHTGFLTFLLGITPATRHRLTGSNQKVRAMKDRCRLYRRTLGGVFYVHDSETGKQESLGTRDRTEAMTLLNACNESVRQPQLISTSLRNRDWLWASVSIFPWAGFPKTFSPIPTWRR